MQWSNLINIIDLIVYRKSAYKWHKSKVPYDFFFTILIVDSANLLILLRLPGLIEINDQCNNLIYLIYIFPFVKRFFLSTLTPIYQSRYELQVQTWKWFFCPFQLQNWCRYKNICTYLIAFMHISFVITNEMKRKNTF